MKIMADSEYQLLHIMADRQELRTCPFKWRMRRNDLPHDMHKCERRFQHNGHHVCQCGAQY